MTTAVLTAPRCIELHDTDLPPIGPRELLVKVLYCGICGSDIHTFLGHNPFVPLPAVLGHELVGEVVEVGTETTGFRAGQVVTFEPTNECGNCLYCRAGEYQRCLQRTPTSGAFREFVLLRADRSYPLPDALDRQRAVLVEPLASALHALEIAGLRPEKSSRSANSSVKVLVLGAGTLGLLLCQAARIYGADFVGITNRSPAKLDLARGFGVDQAIWTSSENKREAYDDILELTGENMIDLVVDTVATAETLNSAVKLLKKGGTLVVLGTPLMPVTMDFGRIMGNELRIAGSMKYRDTFGRAIDLLDTGEISSSGIISEVFALQDIQRAFESIVEHSADFVKCLIRP